MPRSPSTPATPGAVVVEESASPPKPGLFARLFKKAPKVDDEAKTPSPEKPKRSRERAASSPRSLSGAIKALEGTRRINDSDDDRLPESGETTETQSHYWTRREARRRPWSRASSRTG